MSSCVSMTPQRATDTNQVLRNAPLRYGMKRPAISKREMAGHLLLAGRLSIQAQNNRTIDGETCTPKWFFH